MTKFNWLSEYSVGVEEFDFHHKKIFALINDFREAVEKNKIKEITAKVLKDLVKYADFHLKTEEKYFEKFDYKRKEKHIKIHDLYREKVKDFVKRKNEEGTPKEIIEFLEKWWVNHIQKEDKKYTEFFHKNGIY